MSKFKLICIDEPSPFSPEIKHKSCFESDDIVTIVKNFENFLRGAGYNFEGRISLRNVTQPSSSSVSIDTDSINIVGETVTIDFDAISNSGSGSYNTPFGIGDISINLDGFGHSPNYYDTDRNK